MNSFYWEKQEIGLIDQYIGRTIKLKGDFGELVGGLVASDEDFIYLDSTGAIVQYERDAYVDLAKELHVAEPLDSLK